MRPRQLGSGQSRSLWQLNSSVPEIIEVAAQTTVEVFKFRNFPEIFPKTSTKQRHRAVIVTELRRDYRHFENTNAFHFAFDLIARLQESRRDASKTDARRRSGADDVSGLESQTLGE